MVNYGATGDECQRSGSVLKLKTISENVTQEKKKKATISSACVKKTQNGPQERVKPLNYQTQIGKVTQTKNFSLWLGWYTTTPDTVPALSRLVIRPTAKAYTLCKTATYWPKHLDLSLESVID